MNKIYIYTEIMHPRLAYVLRFIQQFNPENEWILITSLNDYQSFQGICINYSKRKIKDQELFIKYSGWLILSQQDYQNIPVRNTGIDFQIFPEVDEIGFDIIAAIFYVLVRIEEYLPFEKDAHLRFPATQSILYKNKALEIPIVDIWVIQFLKTLETLFDQQIKIIKRIPSWSLGIDVDQFFKYKHKSIIQKTGGLIKSFFNGDISECIHRIRILFFNKPDPFDSFKQIESLKIKKEQLLFFILSGGQSPYDKNHALHLDIIQTILNKLKKIARIGLHPSYASTYTLNSLTLEINNLEKVLGLELDLSRQHFLKIQFPETYRTLLEHGIKTDYSLGYADFPGFRAGSCRSFYWYDLAREIETKLIIVPCIAMDRTYLDYLKYSPEKSKIEIQKLFETCINSGGHFHLVWHNSSFDFEGEWKSWEGVLESLIHYFNAHDNLNKILELYIEKSST